MPDRRTIESAVSLACRAPSLHNSQPWRWVATTSRLHLHSDPDRLLPATDAYGRQMVISCGTALNHLHYAFAAKHWRLTIDRMPDPADGHLLSTISFLREPEISTFDRRMMAAISRRSTERLPLAAPPAWKESLHDLTALALEFGVQLEDLGSQSRPALGAASHDIASRRRGDTAYQAELRWWSGHPPFPEGVPEGALLAEQPHGTVDVAREFPPGRTDTDGSDTEHDRAAIVLLATPTDTKLAWLRCGEALSAVLLACTDRGLATCPVTHLTELPTTRALVRALSTGGGQPQVLIRVGVRIRSRSTSNTPRRPLSEVLFRELPGIRSETQSLRGE
ncbi:hypothetical protein EEB14_17265 [Rhodococcus sp. WS4]|nr:hypothetical protein EEB14_17265 [Rhodococcus sp. WS4]